ncbi:MAG: D-alanyl-D-alanine carboxypeptidase [Lachnospiraceae bacterium]|nr:D-alanyl-D-alanine carboxypeptidase [Lachnospiraceae bacterium]
MVSGALSGCGRQAAYGLSFESQSDKTSFRMINVSEEHTAESFAKNLCVTAGDVAGSAQIEDGSAALLCDLNGSRVLYAKNVHERLEPASLTKVMTALVALKYGNLDDIYTASANVEITESGASLIGLKAGDTMTLDQALHGLLMSSGNDAAVLIAEGISGSVEEFCSLMNEEAKKLGATNCHFVNPHGLTEENHYVTAYDMYLIFKEAVPYDEFSQIINSATYSTVYKDRDGNPKEMTCETTNLYLKGNYEPPENIKVIGGKTGTTNSARNCLVLYTKDNAGNPYISVILKCSERGILYEEMTQLLGEIAK